MTGLGHALGRIALGALAAGLAGGAALALAAPRPPRTPRRVRDVAELEAFLGRLVASGNPPGLSVVVVKDGAVAYARAFGLADGPRGVAATPDTVYHWWSMTKIPTAMAVLQLARAGRAAPRRAGDGLPALVRGRLPVAEQPGDHRAPPAHPQLGPARPHAGDDRLGASRRRRARPDRAGQTAPAALQAAPLRAGERRGLQQPELHGARRGHRGGERPDLRGLRRRRVLRPLGMERTGFVYTPALAAHEAAGSLPVVHVYTPLLPFLLDVRALVRERQGRLLWLRRVYLDATPPSGLIGSARDAARLMLAYLAGGELDGARVLAPETVRAMTYDGHIGGRGLGWAVRRAGRAAAPAAPRRRAGLRDADAAVPGGAAGDCRPGQRHRPRLRRPRRPARVDGLVSGRRPRRRPRDRTARRWHCGAEFAARFRPGEARGAAGGRRVTDEYGVAALVGDVDVALGVHGEAGRAPQASAAAPVAIPAQRHPAVLAELVDAIVAARDVDAALRVHGEAGGVARLAVVQRVDLPPRQPAACSSNCSTRLAMGSST